MKLTQVLYSPPVFRFWKEIGAGKDLKKRQGYFGYWKYIWVAYIGRMKAKDHVLPYDLLPPNSRVLEGKDFLQGHVSAMPDDLFRIKEGEKTIYDHPWPYNVQIDEYAKREPIYHYSINSRFFFPNDDIQNLTNTIIESQTMGARPPFEPQNSHIDLIQRRIDHAISGDNVLVRQPKIRSRPRIDQRPKPKYGITRERAETNVLKSLAYESQAMLSEYSFADKDKFNEYLKLSSLSFPTCRVLLERDSQKLGMELFIDHMTLGKTPFRAINPNLADTKSKTISDIHPRTWRSILEKTKSYKDDWAFKFPANAYPRTIYLASRIKRWVTDEEMQARNVAHAFGLTTQVARTNALKLPLTIQIISFRAQPEQSFFFTRYQLNSFEFGDVKNQAWHSGPVSDIGAALRYYLDFENVDTIDEIANLGMPSTI